MDTHRVAQPRLVTAATSIIALVLLVLPVPAMGQVVGSYHQRNLVSDIPGRARSTDANLVNPWGLAHSPTGPWRVSDNGTGVSTQYTRNGESVQPTVTIPPPTSTPGATAAPTGLVFNSTHDFVVTQSGKSAPSQFISATEDGTLSGWSPTVDLNRAILVVDRSSVGLGAVYKGLTTGHNNSGNFLFAANFRFGTVEMFDAHFRLVKSFTDEQVATDCPLANQCFAPFGIQNIANELYVTFALQNPAKHDDVAGQGNGFIDVFDTNGSLIRRFAAHGKLNSPWGLALAPATFGVFSNAVLIGDFGDGRISAFAPGTGSLLGQLKDENGHPITISGLWGLAFGNGGVAGDTNKLFFCAGINDEADGLFGSIEPN